MTFAFVERLFEDLATHFTQNGIVEGLIAVEYSDEELCEHA